MKKKLFLNVIIIFGIIAIVSYVGISFAWYQVENAGTTLTVSSDSVSVDYVTSNIISNSVGIPITAEEVEEKADNCEIAVDVLKMTSGYDYRFNLSFTNIAIDDALKNKDFKWEVLKNGVSVASGTFADISDSTYILYTETFTSVQNNTYKVRIWLNETGQNQNNLMGKSFIAKVEAATLLEIK